MTSQLHDRNVDPAMIAAIAREVVRRLRASKPDLPSAVAEKLITVATLDRHHGQAKIIAAAKAVITPAAREEAKRRGIVIAVDQPRASVSAPKLTARPEMNASDMGSHDPIRAQLARRGLVMSEGVELVWTDRPADEVWRRCGAGKRAVMVTRLSDVDRFDSEIRPTDWVLDRKQLNLVAAVNVAARIAQRSVGAGK